MEVTVAFGQEPKERPIVHRMMRASVLRGGNAIFCPPGPAYPL